VLEQVDAEPSPQRRRDRAQARARVSGEHHAQAMRLGDRLPCRGDLLDDRIGPRRRDAAVIDDPRRRGTGNTCAAIALATCAGCSPGSASARVIASA
jgi:hypothetical protein